MKYTPLYKELGGTGIELVSPNSIPKTCDLCAHRKSDIVVSPITKYRSESGDNVLIVLDKPYNDSDLGRLVNLLIKSINVGFVIDFASRCIMENNDYSDSWSNCNSFLAHSVRNKDYDSIIAMGNNAINAIVGRKIDMVSSAYGYAWLNNGTPVYFSYALDVILRDYFISQDFLYFLKSDYFVRDDLPFIYPGSARIITSKSDAYTAYDDILKHAIVAYDVETMGSIWGNHQIICAALAPKNENYAWVWNRDALNDKYCRNILIDILSDTRIGKIGSNIKYDELSSKRYLGCEIRNVIGDTRLLRKLIDSDSNGRLAVMADLVGMGGHKNEAEDALVAACKQVIKIGKDNASGQLSLVNDYAYVSPEIIADITPGVDTKSFAYGFIPEDICMRYCALDAIATSEIHAHLYNHKLMPPLTRTYEEIVMPAAQAMRQVEYWGAYVDKDRLENFKLYLDSKKTFVLNSIRGYTGNDFNPNSYQDVQALLYNKLNLKCNRKTSKQSLSTDNAALMSMREEHPIVDMLLDWRKYSKLDSSYASGMVKYIGYDGRIHPNILLDGTRSGRPSCRDPNLQTIPRSSDGETGKMARGIFAAPPGKIIASLDYSQIELRVAAILSKDPIMKHLFVSGEDFHWATAEGISQSAWGITIDKNNPEHKKYRTRAKTVNFGLLYGQGDSALAKALDCTIQEAKKVRINVLGKFNVLDKWIKEQLRYAKKHGFCWTYWNGERSRKRYLRDILHKDEYIRSTAERGSWNTPIQGSAAEYLTMSLIKTVNWILDEGIPAKVILPVHDSILLEIDEDYVDEVVTRVQDIMVSWHSDGVPLVVDVEIGNSWGELNSYANI